MANFKDLTDSTEKPTRANMMKQIRDMDLEAKPKAVTKGTDSPMSEGSRTRGKGPNKYTVDRKEGESLMDHKARVEAARAKAAKADE